MMVALRVKLQNLFKGKKPKIILKKDLEFLKAF